MLSAALCAMLAIAPATIRAKESTKAAVAAVAHRMRKPAVRIDEPAVSTEEAATQEQEKKYLPIVLVHGICADKFSMLPTQQYIYKYMPGTYVKNVQIGAGKITSFWNMYSQVDWLRRVLQKDPKLKNGCNIIAHSQGGLVARYFVERYNKPRVYNYISWGSPQCGVFGTPGKIDDRFSWLNIAELYFYRLAYSSLFQRYISFAGYWHDTLHLNNYLKKCEFLPELNNEVHHSYRPLFKKNICSLQNMVLMKSTREDIIEPAASCHFGFYKPGSISDIEAMSDSVGYQEDALGLRTLNESGRLHLKIAHSTHVDMQEDEENFVNNTLPFLTLEKPVDDATPQEMQDVTPKKPKAKKQTAKKHHPTATA